MPPGPYMEMAAVDRPPVGAGVEPPVGSGASRAREVRYANQVHRHTSPRMILAVLAIVVALIGVVPAILMFSGGSNPDAKMVDALKVPSWGAAHPVDHTSGSRWCLSTCLKTDRTMASTRPVNETAAAYTAALRDAGWVPAAANACPPAAKGSVQSCWMLDRHQMNVLITPSVCAGPPPPSTEPGLADPAPSPAGSRAPGCAPTTVDVSIFDRINLKPAKS